MARNGQTEGRYRKRETSATQGTQYSPCQIELTSDSERKESKGTFDYYEHKKPRHNMTRSNKNTDYLTSYRSEVKLPTLAEG